MGRARRRSPLCKVRSSQCRSAPAPVAVFAPSNGTLLAQAVEPTNAVVADVGPTYTVSTAPTEVSAPAAPSADAGSAASGGGDDTPTPTPAAMPLAKDDPPIFLPPPPAALPPAPPPVILAPSQLDLGVPPDTKPLPPPPPEETQQSTAPVPDADPDAELVLYDEPALTPRPLLDMPCVAGVVLMWYHAERRWPAASRRSAPHAPPQRRQRARV